jgi:hypothetical protein
MEVNIMEIKQKENQIQQSNNKFSLVPTSLNEAMKYAELMSNSDIIPNCFKGKPSNILIAVQMGAELGLSPLQALQNISIINGRASIWGDAALALVQNHSAYEDHQEFVEDDVGICRVKRKGQDWYEVRFSKDQAIKAKLWGKPGPWTQYPERMLQLRARGFALRDKFSDALNGLITKEEADDYSNKSVIDIEEVLLTESHLKELRELINEAQVPEDIVAFKMSERCGINGKLTQNLDGFPDSSFNILKEVLEKKIQQKKEIEIQQERLNAG